MNVFVLSWHAPHHNYQDGFSLLKLMKNSDSQYYVCCNVSDESIRKEIESKEPDNVKNIILSKADVSEWADAGVKEFEKLSKHV